MSKTFRARRDIWDDEDVDYNRKSNKARKAERRDRKIRHEMKADDLVRFDGPTFVNDDD